MEKNTTAIKIIFGIILIIVASAGTALGTRVWDPVWNPFRPNPEEVIAKAIGSMGEAETFQSDINLSVNIESEESGSIILDINNKTDVSDENNPKNASIIKASISSPEGMMEIEAEARTINKISYWKINKADFGQVDPMLSLMVSQLKGQWLMVSNEEEVQGDEEIKEKITNLLENKKVFKIKKELPNEKINGEKSYHYLLELDRENIKTIVSEMYKINAEEAGQSEFEADIMAGGYSGAIDSFLEKIGGLQVEVWIGFKSNMLSKIGITKEVDMTDLDKTSTGKADIDFGMTFSDYNKSVEIEEPQDYIDLNEMMAPFMNPYQGGGSETMEGPFMDNGSYLFRASVSEALSGLVE